MDPKISNSVSSFKQPKVKNNKFFSRSMKFPLPNIYRAESDEREIKSTATEILLQQTLKT